MSVVSMNIRYHNKHQWISLVLWTFILKKKKDEKKMKRVLERSTNKKRIATNHRHVSCTFLWISHWNLLSVCLSSHTTHISCVIKPFEFKNNELYAPINLSKMLSHVHVMYMDMDICYVRNVNLFVFCQYAPLLFIFQRFFAHYECLEFDGFLFVRKIVNFPFTFHNAHSLDAPTPQTPALFFAALKRIPTRREWEKRRTKPHSKQSPKASYHCDDTRDKDTYNWYSGYNANLQHLYNIIYTFYVNIDLYLNKL